ncbi:uncharacterized protein LOC143604127 [Bidens hawaiensis]|uniref:uncharacterized protein LOC143604127 n=1 Tax=Bidens hawaiensis TaxID=980011 RepID=UPI0040491517
MESDQPPAETSDDLKQEQTTTHAPRSYQCHYCKRGFTNAQALGGHMNIHRKDKNKPKHSESPAATGTANASPFSISNQGKWFSAAPQADEVKKPLALFDRDDIKRNIHQSGNPPLQDEDVDLELRLGHIDQPQPESTSEKNNIITTRKFF